MGWKEAAEPVLTRMPAVKRPEGHVPFKRKLAWTAGILVLYFFLTNITLLGVGEGATDLFGEFRAILAGEHGSLLQVGIGPIVTASIVMQLLGGANLLGLDTDDPRDQVLYQGLQKLLVIIMTALTALPMVFAGGFLPVQQQPLALAGIELVGTQIQLLMFFQIFLGGILILYMDEVVSKWGIGSGIGLFIIAGVSQKLVAGFISPSAEGFFYSWYQIIFTDEVVVDGIIAGDGLNTLLLNEGQIIPLLTTLLIFGIVVYAESVRVEIPLSHARVKGARGRFPVKLIYASVLPMILVRALQANIQFMGQIMHRVGGAGAGEPIILFGMELPWLGVYADGQPTAGFFYYTAPIYSPEDWMWWTGEVIGNPEVWQILVRITVDLTFMVIGGAIFAIFWVETTNMGPKATARQIQNSGMQIPGFRQNVGVIEKVMERYIPQVTVIGGALVGLLAVMANMLGTIGAVTGTGLLLAVSITYKLYEEIAEEQMMEMHPMMRQMFGKE
ncbi:preprotein translocase subunit SecY [Natronobacterium gregoryi]|uniref:Protein translocase subunit SecY n=2 Tax=Natronobacterium gregoryi TaxID=44930 RepID=L0AER2_NATGS|nr:preprotein translocase subunit SecY [Natronobacterium gregoryi]AFZ71550.1 preprotein translocase, SecY subunit [Natronobacterium gregoryi SP2]ELY66607.1 preprotein translocase subunit SecY [Natronobacterium gregoryi SP2]PLK21319.1 preprotein translocase subunit SecY [Natronobacterium gregoryi SP2]SFI82128.1 protein translocase subunit secY/sec61 alpha [Natronobacterium gregoryi]